MKDSCLKANRNGQEPAGLFNTAKSAIISAMTKRRKILLAIVGGLMLAGVLYLIFSPEPEPSYKGKTLTEWFAVDGGTIAGHDQKREALRHIGTNAIPCMLRWIQYAQPEWKRKFRNFCRDRLQLEPPVDKDELRSWGAVGHFRFLGTNASRAIPELKWQAIHRKPRNSRAMHALALLGKEGLPAIMEALTNQDRNTRLEALNVLPAMGTNAQPALSLLINMLADRDGPVAWGSVHCLGELKLDPDRVIPALTNRLQVTNREQWAIVYALGSYGFKARSAAPVLLKYLNDDNIEVRKCATQALYHIDPEALKRAAAQ